MCIPQWGAAGPAGRAGEGLVPVTITRDVFDKELMVPFKGPGGNLNVVALEVSDGRQAKALANLDEAKPGVYELIITYPTGVENTLEAALTVDDPVIVEKPRTRPRFEIQVGWAPLMIGIDDSNDTLPALPAFELAATIHSGWDESLLWGWGHQSMGICLIVRSGLFAHRRKFSRRRQPGHLRIKATIVRGNIRSGAAGFREYVVGLCHHVRHSEYSVPPNQRRRGFCRLSSAHPFLASRFSAILSVWIPFRSCP
jgi:hypothetical protein